MLTLNEQSVHTGNLILVNASHGIQGTPKDVLVPACGRFPEILLQRCAAALLNELMKEINGWEYIVPVSGYRSQEEQQRIWDDSLRENGVEFTKKYVAVPGHSEHQTGNKRVIFSEVYRNINTATFVTNSQNYKTHAVVYGDGEGTDRTVIEAALDPAATGWERRELMVDARDIQRNELTDAQYRSALIQRGNEKLSECGIVECLEAVTLPNVNFTYKTDYDLGDIVTVHKKAWGIRMDKRITEIQEVYENGGLSIVPTFGDPLPDTVDLSDR